MSIRKEEVRETPHLVNTERDFDIHTLAHVSNFVDCIGSNFVVTGSYAVEALTNTPLVHGDMDGNVFTDDMGRDLPLIATQFEKQGNFVLQKRTDNRLEYDVGLEADITTPRRLEIQFVEIDNVERDGGLEFKLKGQSNHSVPTVSVPFKDSNGHESLLRVKSLPYLIATWAIRISGSAQNSKRPVRGSDLDHLRLLLTGDYEYEDVISAMNKHPQMSSDLTENNVLKQVIQIVS